MMTEDRDPVLASLFADAHKEMDGEEFTALVMAQTSNRNYKLVATGIGAALLLVIVAWSLSLPFEVTQLITRLLTTTLINLGDSWIAWVFSPINNVASLGILTVKGIRIFRKRKIVASYA